MMTCRGEATLALLVALTIPACAKRERRATPAASTKADVAVPLGEPAVSGPQVVYSAVRLDDGSVLLTGKVAQMNEPTKAKRYGPEFRSATAIASDFVPADLRRATAKSLYGVIDHGTKFEVLSLDEELRTEWTLELPWNFVARDFVALPDGRLLTVSVGRCHPDAEKAERIVIDPTTKNFRDAPGGTPHRASGAAGVLSTGEALVAGGHDPCTGAARDSTEMFDEQHGWRVGPRLPTAGDYGVPETTSTSKIQFDAATARVTDGPGLQEARGALTKLVAGQAPNLAYVVGGGTETIEVVDVATDRAHARLREPAGPTADAELSVENTDRLCSRIDPKGLAKRLGVRALKSSPEVLMKGGVGPNSLTCSFDEPGKGFEGFDFGFSIDAATELEKVDGLNRFEWEPYEKLGVPASIGVGYENLYLQVVVNGVLLQADLGHPSIPPLQLEKRLLAATRFVIDALPANTAELLR